MKKENKILGLEDINEILSQTILDLSKRKISPKQAQITSRIALALSKNIQQTNLKKRIEALEQITNKRYK